MGIKVRNLVVQFGGTRAVDDVSFDVMDGEFLVILGPSGCGKTTILRCIAGLVEPTGGEITIDGKVVNGIYPSERNIAMVFQNYALYPHMTVHDNIALNMKMKKIPKEEIKKRVLDVSSKLHISEMLQKKPRQLSGGQAQRVGLARAMVRDPAAFLMDEPLSNLDAKLRNEMRDEMKRFQKITGKCIVYVTHDQIEAMTLGDRILVLNHGKAIQIDEPRRLFDEPRHSFVAGFLGNPPMNILPCTFKANGHGVYDVNVKGSKDTLRLETEGSLVLSEETLIGFRPTDVNVSEGAPFRATLEYVELLGTEMNVHLSIGEGKLIARLIRGAQTERLFHMENGSSVYFGVKENRIFLFNAYDGSRCYVSVKNHKSMS
jgi:multiple sugar transport system ATP-binding protein